MKRSLTSEKTCPRGERERESACEVKACEVKAYTETERESRAEQREEGRERKVRDGEKMDNYVCVYI